MKKNQMEIKIHIKSINLDLSQNCMKIEIIST